MRLLRFAPLLLLGLPACQPATGGADPASAAASTSAAARCEPPATEGVAPLRGDPDIDPFTPEQRALATKLLAIFENRETTLQYAYAEELDDGRGFTVGAVGFTTGTGDALLVIRAYERLAGGAAGSSGATLLRYLPELERLESLPRTDPGRGAVSGLAGFGEAWTAAAADPTFRAAQDSVAERLYYVPALELAAAAGLRTPLARAALLDAIVQHGGGDDPDGLPAMLAATLAARGEPAGGLVEERRWLAHFLGLRRAVLQCAHAPGTREVWRESTSRVDVYEQLLRDGNLHLESPLAFDLDGRRWSVGLDP